MWQIHVHLEEGWSKLHVFTKENSGGSATRKPGEMSVVYCLAFINQLLTCLMARVQSIKCTCQSVLCINWIVCTSIYSVIIGTVCHMV